MKKIIIIFSISMGNGQGKVADFSEWARRRSDIPSSVVTPTACYPRVNIRKWRLSLTNFY